MDIKNRVAMVTGANRGIGKALVESLLQNAVTKIYATARDSQSLPDFNDERVIKLQLDITNEQHISNTVKLAGDINLLINNAGTAELVSALTGPLTAIKNDMETNYFGTLAMIRAFKPVLEKQQDSALVNIVSISAFVNNPLASGYCASKAALFSLSQGLRIALAQTGISVHTVNPGPIDTDMISTIEIEKTSPSTAANNIIEGLLADEADIFPDPMSQQMFDLWQHNYRDLENMVAQAHNP